MLYTADDVEALRLKAEQAAIWIAGGEPGAPQPELSFVMYGGGGFEFSTRGMNFVYLSRGWLYDDDPWNERNLSKVEHEEGVQVILRCTRHGNTRFYPYGLVPWQMPMAAQWSGQVRRCNFCYEPARWERPASGRTLDVTCCAHCAKVRFHVPDSALWSKPRRHPRYTKTHLRKATEAFLNKVRAWNPECHECVTLVNHHAGFGNITYSSLRRTY